MANASRPTPSRASQDSGAIILNGATAHLGKAEDRLTIMSYATVEEAAEADWQPKVIVLGDNNAIIATR